ncbi:hypothetical protein DPMN_121814 [Dreissena polymorpha]|uniref:G-protein coupled receptors family 1 profile domain-containing protein n=1 Tax=Dreissena polymorpha TaxID=45954 RepID=A0A9D4JPT2_DREPO|nr:hypothetical protein DPMN_121814 [Dreissena polymorpha]
MSSMLSTSLMPTTHGAPISTTPIYTPAPSQNVSSAYYSGKDLSTSLMINQKEEQDEWNSVPHFENRTLLPVVNQTAIDQTFAPGLLETSTETPPLSFNFSYSANGTNHGLWTTISLSHNMTSQHRNGNFTTIFFPNPTSLENTVKPGNQSSLTTETSEEPLSSSFQNFLIGLFIFAGLVVVVNFVVLAASKFTTGGKSSTLIFIRSLCISDMLIGMFGMLKYALLRQTDMMISCFLPESVFISASTAICLTLLWMNLDSYLRLTKPLGYILNMNKHNVIITTILLWNFALILGFLPLMQWIQYEYRCNFFEFYKIAYVIFVSTLWIVCISGSCITQVLLHRASRRIQQNSAFISPRSMEFLKNQQLVATIRNDIFLLTICYLPLLSYIFHYSINQTQNNYSKANDNMIFFLPVFLTRSFISAFVHSYRTIKIQRIMHNVSKNIGISMCNRPSYDTSSEGPASASQSRLNSIVNLDANGTQHAGVTPHRNLCQTSSLVTIIMEEDSETDNHEISFTKL